LVNVIIADMVVLQDRGFYMGIVSLSSALGLVSGSVLGSWLAESFTWRL
jgi:predicted MFS family arabinose efflux permease